MARKKKINLRARAGRIMVFLLTTFVFALVMVVLVFFFFGSPREKMQARELEYLKLQYQILDDKLDEMQAVMDELHSSHLQQSCHGYEQRRR